ncbi:response regulator [Chitinophaga sp. CF418]|uniref:response regulator n=1 Tax=Chitinophaga sp. CF418 TaxID=1855287 RepID=UPI0009172744|nr:response regulator [Chitinophaga sp. CF418]SHN43350.1 Response regulator receiver domain-containing protein [Chitinophaga sp. CF418]
MDSKAKIIFLADDDPEDQEILKDAILSLDPTADIHSVVNGQQAIEYLLNCPDNCLPALLILDYKMPIYNAIEILEKIQNVPRLKSIPKVVWSTSNLAEHVRSCIEKGALQYFVKPTRTEELNNIARQMLDAIDN